MVEQSDPGTDAVGRSADPRVADTAVFAASLRRLFTAAGSPPVAQIASEVGVSAGTVSHWRTGRHLPAEFAVIEPLLVLLIDRAHRNSPNRADTDTASESRAAGVMSVRQWHSLFDAAVGGKAVGPALDQIAVAAEQWAERADPPALAAGRRVLLDCIAVSSTGQTASRPSHLDHDRHNDEHLIMEALTELGVLTPASPASEPDASPSSSAVVIVDIELATMWPRLARWVAAAWPALGARTGLEHDARRWHAAGRPRMLLYDYRRLELTANALTTLHHPTNTANSTADEDAAGGDGQFRFGGAKAADVPAEALTFWAASQSEALHRLRVDQIIMTLLITLAAMVLALGFTLAAVTR